MKSAFLRLAANDFIKGLVVAILGALIGYGYQVFQSNSFTSFNWHDVVKIGVGASLAYLSKNFITNSDGFILKKEDK